MRKTSERKVRINITIPQSVKKKIERKRETEPDFIVSSICTKALVEALEGV